MTIYTPSVADKKVDERDLVDPEVVTKPLTSFKEDEGEEASPKYVRVTYFPHSRRTFCIHLLLTIMVLVILACGAIGAVVFYRHMHRKHQVYSGRCGTVYIDSDYVEDPQALWSPDDIYNRQKKKKLQEEIEVSLSDNYESFYTPQFDEVRETFVWHDFQNNYTALIEHTWRLCYVMKLNRTRIAPPRDIVDLISKAMTGYYLPEARVLRENYRMALPPLTDLSQFGPGIQQKCKRYETFWLMKLPDDLRWKRSVAESSATYAMLTNHLDDQVIYKMNVLKE